MTKFIKQGDRFRVTDDSNLVVASALPAGTYTVHFNEMTGEFSLETIKNYNHVGKIYGDVDARVARIMNTFLAREASTGVLLSGEKGTGKTLLAKLLSAKALGMGIPTIAINAALHGEGFNRFIQSINQPCVILFDEFEKVYAKDKLQEAMLTLLDGVYPTHKLFILTTNDRFAINRCMINRPGRVFYNIEYRGLDDAFVEEYAKDTLDDKTQVEGIMRISSIFREFNFDMLKAIVEEMNRYKESAAVAIKMMNVKPESHRSMYEADFKAGGITPFHYSREMELNPLEPFGVIYYANKNNVDNGDQQRAYFSVADIVAMNKDMFVYRQEGFELTLKPKKYDASADFLYRRLGGLSL